MTKDKPATPVITTYTVVDGDSYASIAAAHPVAGKTTHQRATHLHTINNSRPLTPGVTIKL